MSNREVLEMSDADAEEARAEAFRAGHESCETCGETLCMEAGTCDCGWDAGERAEDGLADHADRGICRVRGTARVAAAARLGAKVLLDGSRS